MRYNVMANTNYFIHCVYILVDFSAHTTVKQTITSMTGIVDPVECANAEIKKDTVSECTSM